MYISLEPYINNLNKFLIHVPTTSYGINLHILSFQLLIGSKKLLLVIHSIIYDRLRCPNTLQSSIGLIYFLL
jgi:hypothetical protein